MRLYWPAHGMPHGYICGTPVHLIYRLRGCVPVGPLRVLSDGLREQLVDMRSAGHDSSSAYQRLIEEYEQSYDALLDAQDQAKYLLSRSAAAHIVLESWAFLEKKGRCRRLALCVMGNHVHVLVEGLSNVDPYQIGDLVGQHKRFTDDAIRKSLQTTDKIWELGFFDRYVRPGTLDTVIAYILNNPVKAGLVRDWRDWPHTYLA